LVAWCLIGSASPVVSTGRHQVLFSAEQVTIGYPLGATFFFEPKRFILQLATTLQTLLQRTRIRMKTTCQERKEVQTLEDAARTDAMNPP
jgi:hypothetical protein